jgi:hypothetical protein
LWDDIDPRVSDYVSAVESVLARIVETEWEYRESPEYIAEMMEANEYTFTVSGGRFG